MRKLLVFVALFAMVGVSYAQESVNRSVGVYFDAYSGDMVNADLASDNCFEFGVGYSQNFSSAQWLTVSVSALVAVGQQTAYDIDDDKWVGNIQTDTEHATTPRAKIGLDFGGFGYLSADTRSLVSLGGGYGHDLGNAGSVSYGVDVDFFAVPLDLGYNATDKKHDTYSLDLFQVHVGYSVPFASSWGFNTKLMFRFGDENAFVDNFAIRWDNTVSYEVDGFGLWGRVRYHVANIANDVDVVNSVYLQAGVSYGFDFSGN